MRGSSTVSHLKQKQMGYEGAQCGHTKKEYEMRARQDMKNRKTTKGGLGRQQQGQTRITYNEVKIIADQRDNLEEIDVTMSNNTEARGKRRTCREANGKKREMEGTASNIFGNQKDYDEGFLAGMSGEKFDCRNVFGALTLSCRVCRMAVVHVSLRHPGCYRNLAHCMYCVTGTIRKQKRFTFEP